MPDAEHLEIARPATAASPILPALAVKAMSGDRPRVAMVCGGHAVIPGIGAPALGDLPAGPVLVFAYAALAVLLRGASLGR